MTAPMAEIEAALRAFAPAIAQRRPGAARVLGVHLEGPYLNPERLGAQPDHIVPAALVEVQRLHALAPIRVLTLAPELPGHLALIGPLRDPRHPRADRAQQCRLRRRLRGAGGGGCGASPTSSTR